MSETQVFILKILESNFVEHAIPAVACFVIAAILAKKKVGGWGWFVFIGALFGGSYS